MTTELKKAISELEAINASLEEAKKKLATVRCLYGQVEPSIYVCGVPFKFTTLDRSSGWTPYVVKGCEELQQAAEKIMVNYVRVLEGRAEGATWKVKQLAKELT